jgi:PilZ domain
LFGKESLSAKKPPYPPVFLAAVSYHPRKFPSGRAASTLLVTIWATNEQHSHNPSYHHRKGHLAGGSSLGSERRRTPRYTFIASAELIEETSDVRIATRVSELSLYGCYLDMMNPFPVGTSVLVKISAGDAFFEAKSKIVYAQPNMGAGVVFLETEAQYQPILERWLDEAARSSQKRVG